MKNIILAAMVLVGLFEAPAALAGDDGMYVLGGAGKIASGDSGKSSVDELLSSAGGANFSSNMGTPAVYKLQIGYQLDDNWSLEGGYIGSHNVNYAASGGNLASAVSSTSRISGWNLNWIATLPLEQGFSVFGKLGFANMQELASLKSTAFTDYTSGSKTDLTYGVGVKFDITHQIFVRLDVDRYNIGTSNASSSNTVGMLDLGFRF